MAKALKFIDNDGWVYEKTSKKLVDEEGWLYEDSPIIEAAIPVKTIEKQSESEIEKFPVKPLEIVSPLKEDPPEEKKVHRFAKLREPKPAPDPTQTILSLIQQTAEQSGNVVKMNRMLFDRTVEALKDKGVKKWKHKVSRDEDGLIDEIMSEEV